MFRFLIPFLGSHMMGRASTGETRDCAIAPELLNTREARCVGVDARHSSQSGDRRYMPLARLRFPALAHFFLFDLVALAGREKKVGFKAVLASVEIVVAAALCKQFSMVAAFEDEALLDY